MIQYKVPQNVQREDTLIGPLTLRHLIILGIGGGLAYAIYVSLARTYFIEVWLPPVAIIVVLTLAFAFLKIHDLLFHVYLMSFLEYKILPRKRVWIQGTGDPFESELNKKKVKKEEKIEKKTLEQTDNLEELTKVLDTHGGSETSAAEEERLKHQELKKIIDQNYKQN